MKRRIVVILGPTASGKTALGIALAKRFGGVVLSADSRQVYRGMDVGTAKVTRQEMRGVPHYLIDIVSPKRTFTVALYQKRALELLRRIPATTPVFVVGGSPFYIEAILDPTPFPDVVPDRTLRRRLSRKSTEQLFALLKKKDPVRAAAIDLNNPRRLIRALEIVSALGSVPARANTSPYRVLKIGIEMPRATLYRRIDRRVDARASGILDEARRLRRNGLSWKRLEAFGLEYRWAAHIITKQVSRTEGITRLKGDIHAFARRQLTWWRKDKKIHWTQNRPRLDRGSAERLVHTFLT